MLGSLSCLQEVFVWEKPAYKQPSQFLWRQMRREKRSIPAVSYFLWLCKEDAVCFISFIKNAGAQKNDILFYIAPLNIGAQNEQPEEVREAVKTLPIEIYVTVKDAFESTSLFSDKAKILAMKNQTCSFWCIKCQLILLFRTEVGHRGPRWTPQCKHQGVSQLTSCGLIPSACTKSPAVNKHF